MKKNLGLFDRGIRFAGGIVALIWAIAQGSWIALLVAIFLFVQALWSFCPFYALFGVNHCPLNRPSDDDQRPAR